ncbi:integrase core domain-containing protein [Rhodococcus sp. BH5]|nr:integrase core domain-containing protein [Rhodococcus sp. BH5]MCZ9635202.1 integrase core domain-containing protein [Rhodococcus sp. BH5]
MQFIDDIEFATMEWVDWFNTRRLHSTLDYVTPDEFEAIYYVAIMETAKTGTVQDDSQPDQDQR